MRRFQMMLDDELDDALERAARERGASKAELLRQFARQQLVGDDAVDPLDRLAGMAGPDAVEDEHTGVVAEHVTEVLYATPPS